MIRLQRKDMQVCLRSLECKGLQKANVHNFLKRLANLCKSDRKRDHGDLFLGKAKGAGKEGRSIMKKNIKKVTSLALVAVMAASLAACGGGGSSSGGSGGQSADGGSGDSADGKITLRFSWWGGDSRHEATERRSQPLKQNIRISMWSPSTAPGPAGRRSSP